MREKMIHEALITQNTHQKLILELNNFCKFNKIKGTILIASEGINATVAGFEKDIRNIIEGRFGSSIRLGSTISTNSMMQNNWSNKTPKGDPIMILRNGNRSTGQPAFTPITEKIQEDPSSIYLTSTQKIPFEPSSKNYTALEKAPIEPGSYKDSQIILNSGRLILNSKVDSILLSSQKSINLASVEDIGIASDKDVTIEADNIFLGGKLSNQPAINGEYFMTQFGFITFGLKTSYTCWTKSLQITSPLATLSKLFSTSLVNV